MVLSTKNGGGGGILYLKITSAELIRNTEMFGKMDPFVMVEYKGMRKSTTVCKSGGQHPFWGKDGHGEFVEFKIKQMADEIDFYCYDEDMISNDLIGSQRMSVFHLCTTVYNRHSINIFFK